jgi:DNA-binding IscR family transcriptional regulator
LLRGESIDVFGYSCHDNGSPCQDGHGGYSLAREPSQINLKEIVDLLEGDSSLVDCVKDPSACSRVPICVSRDVWAMIGGKISETLSAITLDTLVKMNQEKTEQAIMHNI